MVDASLLQGRPVLEGFHCAVSFKASGLKQCETQMYVATKSCGGAEWVVTGLC